MTTNYQGNSKKAQAKVEEPTPKKEVEKVVVNEVVVQKKGLGRKFKGFIADADIGSVMQYVVTDVLIPAARDAIVDSATKGVSRMMYGESNVRRRSYGTGPRVTYNNPINRGFRDVPSRQAPPQRPYAATSRRTQDDLILASKDEAELVVERMNDIIDKYQVVSVADLHELVGLPTTHVDHKWGWVYLGTVAVRQIREGYLIDLPDPEPVQ